MTGRPAWIPTDSICEQAREMASNGLTVAQIADCLGVSESTLYVEDVQPRDLEKTSVTRSVTSGSVHNFVSASFCRFQYHHKSMTSSSRPSKKMASCESV